MYSERIVAQCVVQRAYHAGRIVGTGTLTVLYMVRYMARYMVRYMVRYGTSVLRYVSVTLLYCSVQTVRSNVYTVILRTPRAITKCPV